MKLDFAKITVVSADEWMLSKLKLTIWTSTNLCPFINFISAVLNWTSENINETCTAKIIVVTVSDRF